MQPNKPRAKSHKKTRVCMKKGSVVGRERHGARFSDRYHPYSFSQRRLTGLLWTLDLRQRSILYYGHPPWGKRGDKNVPRLRADHAACVENQSQRASRTVHFIAQRNNSRLVFYRNRRQPSFHDRSFAVAFRSRTLRRSLQIRSPRAHPEV